MGGPGLSLCCAVNEDVVDCVLFEEGFDGVEGDAVEEGLAVAPAFVDVGRGEEVAVHDVFLMCVGDEDTVVVVAESNVGVRSFSEPLDCGAHAFGGGKCGEGEEEYERCGEDAEAEEEEGAVFEEGRFPNAVCLVSERYGCEKCEERVGEVEEWREEKDEEEEGDSEEVVEEVTVVGMVGVVNAGDAKDEEEKAEAGCAADARDKVVCEEKYSLFFGRERKAFWKSARQCGIMLDEEDGADEKGDKEKVAR